jgi:iron complex transport system ATP-binding protein
MTFPFAVDDVVRLGVPPAMTRARADRHVARAMEAVDLVSDFAARPVTLLSGGEQQRVHMARVLVQLWAHAESGRPGYLLLDEPTAHLDPAHQAQIVRIARDHVRAGGGVLAVLHDLNLAATMADTVVVMDSGRIAASGAPNDVLVPAILEKTYRVGFEVSAGTGKRWIMQDFQGTDAPGVPSELLT